MRPRRDALGVWLTLADSVEPLYLLNWSPCVLFLFFALLRHRWLRMDDKCAERLSESLNRVAALQVHDA